VCACVYVRVCLCVRVCACVCACVRVCDIKSSRQNVHTKIAGDKLHIKMTRMVFQHVHAFDTIYIVTYLVSGDSFVKMVLCNIITILLITLQKSV